MALQIWLPLRGNLENNGLLGDAQISCVSPNIQDNGKIGKCYSCTTNNNRIEIKHNNLKTIFKKGNSYSIALWVYINSMSNEVHAIFGNYNNSSFFNIQFNGALNSENNPSGWVSVLCGTPTDYITEKGFIRTQGVWTHIAITYDGDKTIAFYKNGEQQLIKTNIDYKLISDSVDTFFIGGDKTGRALNGQINDFRIYDHCLSEKEVEEISKGLIMHYMLNTPKPNLLENTMVKTPTTYAAGSILLKEKLIPNKKYTLQLWNLDISNSATSESTIGFGLWWYDDNHPLFKVLGSSNFDSGSTGINVHKDYLKYTFTMPSSSPSIPEGTADQLKFYNSPKASGGGIAASGTLNFNIERWKLEEGEVATPFEENIIYDCSGYRNNGIAHNIIGISPSPKYNTATNFNGTAYINNIPTIISTASYNSEFTFSAWIKRNYTDAVAKTIYNGIVRIYLNSSFKPCMQWTMQKTTGETLGNNWAPNAMPAAPENDWIHIVFTFEDGIVKCYANGKYKTFHNRTEYGIYIGTAISTFLGASTTTTEQFIGDISDVRVYMTALSDDQIKDLYNTSMAIDSNGNVYARELIE